MWVGIVLFAVMLFLIWKRHWLSLFTLIVAVPGGMLLNELIKVVVHRPRPFLEGPFVDWSGYSFASGHTIGATLLYGQLALLLLPIVKARSGRAVMIGAAVLLVSLVGFSRIALGAHYLSDVLGAIVLGVLWLALCLLGGRRIHQHAISVDMLSETDAVLVPVQAPAEQVPPPLA